MIENNNEACQEPQTKKKKKNKKKKKTEQQSKFEEEIENKVIPKKSSLNSAKFDGITDKNTTYSNDDAETEENFKDNLNLIVTRRERDLSFKGYVIYIV